MLVTGALQANHVSDDTCDTLGGAYGRRQHRRPGRRWQLPPARSQGAAPQPGLPPIRAAASRGSARTRRHRPLARCRPRAAAHAARAAAHANAVVTQMGARGVRASF
ncbi:hypothetical protein BHM03_00058228 [Ensete ventricosum]|uniref:Uncharacterized protein n=1 Tax=Ensete ventricosum TaxID=4639 RepID=A0A445MMK7_ENSVE|nr:hypothetical protein BHM03_00058228 [Ensete ventricosum]